MISFALNCIKASYRITLCLIAVSRNAYHAEGLSEALRTVSLCRVGIDEMNVFGDPGASLLKLKLYYGAVQEVTRKDYRVRSRGFFICKTFYQFPEFS